MRKHKEDFRKSSRHFNIKESAWIYPSKLWKHLADGDKCWQDPSKPLELLGRVLCLNDGVSGEVLTKDDV